MPGREVAGGNLVLECGLAAARNLLADRKDSIAILGCGAMGSVHLC